MHFGSIPRHSPTTTHVRVAAISTQLDPVVQADHIVVICSLSSHDEFNRSPPPNVFAQASIVEPFPSQTSRLYLAQPIVKAEFPVREECFDGQT